MTHLLENDQCRAAIHSHGAELSSFIRKDLDGLEYIWQANPDVWARHAPVLFPIVGRLPNDSYVYKGKEFNLPQHGFARDQEFNLTSQTSDELTFSLNANEATRAHYPFDFQLTIIYRLRGTTLTVGWQVHNPAAEQELLFSIGAHPAFRCPLLPNEQFEDYYFQFDHAVSFERHLLTGGLLTGQTEPVVINHTELPLTYALFADDALALKKFDFTHLTLRSRRSERAVRLRFDGFPYLGLWTKGPGAPFVCVEPWQGIASTVGNPQELADKEGVLNLPPSQTFNTQYSITVE
ncbi:Aldose 1-epimerase [Hymenobacter roseosalivarius DSM 11622]|uniref:Aldose 1-epimerase n=1 Tax=Hymenobacter roseosalivarius DSM 11622 TaxID=645990 RepID=A0A1W1VTD7_9BACT|nr:aldose 1-epimerase family protein [Hymenobacter roseosalivarius]SMB96632.1 Aldose 1-epimerase [Hymenobacter roseosalivarius DSM 11622]